MPSLRMSTFEGFHVAVDDADRVGGGERAEELLEVVPGARHRDPRRAPRPADARAGPVPRDEVGQRAAVDELHRQHERARPLEELVEAHDVGVLQVPERLGFGHEQRAQRVLGPRARLQHLQGERPRRFPPRSPFGAKKSHARQTTPSPFAEARLDDEPAVAELERRAGRNPPGGIVIGCRVWQRGQMRVPAARLEEHWTQFTMGRSRG